MFSMLKLLKLAYILNHGGIVDMVENDTATIIDASGAIEIYHVRGLREGQGTGTGIVELERAERAALDVGGDIKL